MVIMAAGFVLLCLLAGRVRLAGFAVHGRWARSWRSTPPPPPDLLVEATGENVALRDGDGHLVPAQPRRARFSRREMAAGQWRGGEPRRGRQAAPAGLCRDDRCTAEVKGRRVLYVSGRRGQASRLQRADILIADFPAARRLPQRAAVASTASTCGASAPMRFI